MSWHLQQINNVNGQGPTVPGEFMACPQATARAFLLSIAVSAFGSQLHFAYFDSGGNIQDCWYDGPTKSWNLRQINNTGGQGPSVPGEDVACPQATATANASGGLCLSVFGDQLHFAYVDSGGNIQDCWYDGPTNSWILRQINNAGGQGPTVPGEDVACPQA